MKAEGSSLTIATPKMLFSSNPAPVGVDFDVTADGKKFLVNVADNDTATSTLHLVTNWTADLKKK